MNQKPTNKGGKMTDNAQELLKDLRDLASNPALEMQEALRRSSDDIDTYHTAVAKGESDFKEPNLFHLNRQLPEAADMIQGQQEELDRLRADLAKISN